MANRLYYHDPFLFDFDARVLEATPVGDRLAVILDQTAFYPTSGGQVFDTGKLGASGDEFLIVEVGEGDGDDAVVHFLAASQAAEKTLTPGTVVHGTIDADRRRDHMQQHTGQHVLSAAFVRRFEMQTVSFHMGAESCTIDLDTPSLTPEQVIEAEQLANQIVFEDRPVDIRFVPLEEARGMGLRKLPPREGEIRLIDIHDFDLTACGGTHVARTGQVGAVLLRKVEKARQGMRVEFVCGGRAVATARQDYGTLVGAAEMFSAHIREVPQQIGKQTEELKATRKREQQVLGEFAELEAARLLRKGEQRGEFTFVVKQYEERDAAFIKLLAQKIAALKDAKAVALLGALSGQPTIVLAQTAGLPSNAGALLKDALTAAGGRGGGSHDMAQGGVPDAEKLRAVMSDLSAKLRG